MSTTNGGLSPRRWQPRPTFRDDLPLFGPDVDDSAPSPTPRGGITPADVCQAAACRPRLAFLRMRGAPVYQKIGSEKGGGS